VKFRQLLPECVEAEVPALIASMDLSARAPGERPYVVANFISSADGRASFKGRSGALGDPADRLLFHGLREQVDAVLAGTRTMSIERYGRIIRDPDARRRREQAGRSPEPLAVLVSRRGAIPTDIPLFAEPEARIVVFSGGPFEPAECSAQVELVRVDPAEMTLTTALRRLRSDFGVASLMCEGGPTLFGSLLDEGLVDELFLTLAPKLVGGGDGPAITGGPELMELQPTEVVWALEHDNSLYLRYRLT
jgi:riboflavin-specific deaminase-like protein